MKVRSKSEVFYLSLDGWNFLSREYPCYAWEGMPISDAIIRVKNLFNFIDRREGYCDSDSLNSRKGKMKAIKKIINRLVSKSAKHSPENLYELSKHSSGSYPLCMMNKVYDIHRM